MAAYAARAPMRGLVLLTEGAPASFRSQIQSYGSKSVTVAGSVLEVITTLWRDHGWYVAQRNAPGMNGRPFGNPFGMEGYKTIAYEIYHQMGRRVPDRVYVPTSGGDGVWGVYKGFHELQLLGLADHIPKVIACQSAAAAPLVWAIQRGLPHIEPIETQPTIALSLLDPQSGDLALHAVNRSHGTAIAVTDEEILDAIDEMSGLGLSVEPASAASLAGLVKHTRGGLDSHGQSIVLIASGSGERWPATFTRIAARLPETITPLSDLRALVQ
jgi:threonine synthase